MTYFTGIDVSLRSVSICIVDDKGEVCREAKLDAQVDVIAGWLRAFSPDVTSVGFEAGALSQYLTYGLQAAGFEVICLEARQVKNTLSAMRNKTDRNDARGIAQILRTGWYSRVHIKSLHSHRVRALLASRKAILKKCVDLENELRGLLRVFGTRLASRVGQAYLAACPARRTPRLFLRCRAPCEGGHSRRAAGQSPSARARLWPPCRRCPRRQALPWLTVAPSCPDSPWGYSTPWPPPQSPGQLAPAEPPPV